MLVLPAIVCMAWLVIKHVGRSVLELGAVESAYSLSERLQGQAHATSWQSGIAAQLGAVHSSSLVQKPFLAAADYNSSDCQFAYALSSYWGGIQPLFLCDFGALGLRKFETEWIVREKLDKYGLIGAAAYDSSSITPAGHYLVRACFSLCEPTIVWVPCRQLAF